MASDPMHATGDLQGVARVIVLIAGAVVILVGIKLATPVVAPLLLAIVFAILFGLIIRWLERRRVPHWLAVTVAIILFLATIAVFFLLIVASFVQLIAQVPEYQSSIERALSMLLGPMGIPVPTISSLVASLSAYSVEALSSIVSGVTAVALVIIATLFFLIEADSFAAKIRAMFAHNPRVLSHFGPLGGKIVDYVVIRTEVNAATGVGIGLIIAAVGVDYAVFWGFLAFALSYIPYIGFWLAVIPPMLVAWSEIGAIPAVIILVGAAIINLLAENVLFPQAAGKGLHQSPAVVFISLAFWGFVLGGTGALLAVPLTLALIMVLDYFDETKWLAILLGPADFVVPESEPGPAEEIERADSRPPG